MTVKFSFIPLELICLCHAVSESLDRFINWLNQYFVGPIIFKCVFLDIILLTILNLFHSFI
jgi:hypothetical protein